MNKITYDELSGNKIVEKTISARKPMTDKAYDTV